MNMSKLWKTKRVAVFGGSVVGISVVLGGISGRSRTAERDSETSGGTRDRIVDAGEDEEAPQRITNQFGMDFVEIHVYCLWDRAPFPAEDVDGSDLSISGSECVVEHRIYDALRVSTRGKQFDGCVTDLDAALVK